MTQHKHVVYVEAPCGCRIGPITAPGWSRCIHGNTARVLLDHDGAVQRAPRGNSVLQRILTPHPTKT